MKLSFRFLLVELCVLISSSATFGQIDSFKDEPHRPKVHFSPKEKWMNDPNGMVYYNGDYHLFYQYYPGSTVWGPMHWGHAVSKNMIQWEHLPIALYPDSLGYIFSGSIVVDFDNTSGFGKNGKPPLIAIFTHHDPKGEREGRSDFQNQSIAYSNDDGKAWIKYENNPVIKNPGIKDFRDPKVMWYEKDKKWIMTLATKDHITFYSSPNLKQWERESEFGENIGAHGGVWECPDLFPLKYKRKTVWVLIVNLNPGGPNKGSATQYFLGDFDGKRFTAFTTDTKWVDYGPDEYAGVTWSNTNRRKIFLGWMSNWDYATVVPTEKWRSAMTIPRDLKIIKANNTLLIASRPIKELNEISSKPVIIKKLQNLDTIDLLKQIQDLSIPCTIDLTIKNANDLLIVLSNRSGEETVIGYDKIQNRFFIDRTRSGIINFNQGFGAKHFAPRFSISTKMKISLVIDESSVELFADDGLTVMTEIFFPTIPYDHISIQSTPPVLIKELRYKKMKAIGQ